MSGPTVQLEWQGEISIEELTPRKEALLRALNDAAEVTIDVSAAVRFDLATLQLLCAACGSASIRGSRLRLVGGDNPPLAAALREHGLNFRENCLRSRSTRCLWHNVRENEHV